MTINRTMNIDSMKDDFFQFEDEAGDRVVFGRGLLVPSSGGVIATRGVCVLTPDAAVSLASVLLQWASSARVGE